MINIKQTLLNVFRITVFSETANSTVFQTITGPQSRHKIELKDTEADFCLVQYAAAGQIRFKHI